MSMTEVTGASYPVIHCLHSTYFLNLKLPIGCSLNLWDLSSMLKKSKQIPFKGTRSPGIYFG